MADKAKEPAAAGSRRNWDKEAYAAKAKAQDAEGAERAKAAEAALKQGKKPPRPKRDDNLPKPTRKLEARTEDLGIEKNLNKTMLVTAVGGKTAKPGFYCELCRRTLKDSIAYLDHVNGRSHLAALGQTTQVRRSTLSEVQERIAHLRAASKEKVTSRTFDFDARLRKVREEEEARRAEKREAKKRKRVGVVEASSAKTRTVAGTKGAFGNRAEVEAAEREAEEMAQMMGFGGFGGGVKGKR